MNQAVLATATATFDALNQNLVHDEANNIECGSGNVDCPVYYTPDAIAESVAYMEKKIQVLRPVLDARYLKAHRNATEQCKKDGGGAVLKSGGWCLESSHKWVGCLDISSKVGCEIRPNGRDAIPVPEYHALPAKVVVDELIQLIDKEEIQSFNDFGAGIGQYKTGVENQRPQVVWRSYDGAGNVEEWTKGYVEWVDLTQPLSLPKADWVISLEVGEHISNSHEGMFLRNLHQHNCKGIILSWAILGQGGKSHINTHSSSYVISLVEALGYTWDSGLTKQFRRNGDNHFDQYEWFKKSILVFRRNINPC